MQASGAIVKYELINRNFPLAGGFHPGGDDFSTRQRRGRQFQIGDALKVSAVLVAAGSVQQEVADVAQGQAFQLRGAF